MPEIAYLNGEFMAQSEAKVSVDDRGFQFGDGVYEGLRSYGGRLWAVERHWGRLANSLAGLQITGLAISDVDARVREAYARSGIADAFVYLQVTRGVAPRAHAFDAGMTPTVLITVRPFHPPSPSDYARGVAAITFPELRWARRDIKSTNLLGNVLAKTEARARDAFEALLVEHDGLVTEGASTSLFIVRDGVLVTREAGPHILPGITQQLLLEIAAEEGIAATRRPFTEAELRTADEAFLAGTTADVLPITRLDGAPLGGGTPGPLTRRLRAAYVDGIAREADAPVRG